MLRLAKRTPPRMVLGRNSFLGQINGVRYLFNNNNDIDFCFRLREKGYKIICTPNAKLFHHESASRGLDIKNSYKVIKSFNHLIIQSFKQLNIESSGFNSEKLQR